MQLYKNQNNRIYSSFTAAKQTGDGAQLVVDRISVFPVNASQLPKCGAARVTSQCLYITVFIKGLCMLQFPLISIYNSLNVTGYLKSNFAIKDLFVCTDIQLRILLIGCIKIIQGIPTNFARVISFFPELYFLVLECPCCCYLVKK